VQGRHQLQLKFRNSFHSSSALRLQLESVVPNFNATTTHGPIDFFKWKGNSWALLVSHPRDFTPVCTTELSELAKLEPELAKRGVKPIGLSCDKIEKHVKWEKDVIAFGKLSGKLLPYPVIADPDRSIAKTYGMLDPTSKHPEDQLQFTVRSVFLVDGNNRLRLELTYPASTGRNWTEVIRAIDSIKLAEAHPIATPHGWTPGDRVVVVPSISTENAKQKFPDVEVVTPYLRFINDPSKANKK